MKVVVCIKQVPVGSVPMENGALDRNRAGGQLNPWDQNALEAGLRIAEATGGSCTAISMGPENAAESLRTALSMGVTEGVLLCDRAFAGADVYATAYTLAQGIRALGQADVIVCGQQTTDGDTAQVPFSLGAQLEIPAVGWVKQLERIEEKELTVLQELTYGTQRIRISTPCLLAVGKTVGIPRIPTLRDQLRAKKLQIRHLGLEDLRDRDPGHYGQTASPTRVVRAYLCPQSRKQEPLTLPPEQAAERILALWRQKGGGENG